MRNFTTLFAFFIGLLLVSCDENSDNQAQNDPNNSQTLVSITKDYTYTSDNYTEVINFENGKITDIQYSNGKYDLYTYLNGKVSQIVEYNSDATIFLTRTFTYDSNDRLIERREIYNPEYTETDVYVVYEFSYFNNMITNTSKFYDFDDVLQEGEGLIQIDLDGNKIIRSHTPEQTLIFRDELTYSGSNPIIATHFFSNEPNIVINFDYSNDVAANAYNIAKFKFGTEWKNNLILSAIGNGYSALSSASIVSQMSDNYLTSYVQESSSTTRTANIEYEFDSNNVLIGQVETVVSLPSEQTFITIISYEYE